MRQESKYDSSGLIEAQFEPGSRGRVFKNLLGIRKKREMNIVEAREQLRAMADLVRLYDKNHRFTTDDLYNLHRIWFGSVYPWAGKYRR